MCGFDKRQHPKVAPGLLRVQAELVRPHLQAGTGKNELALPPPLTGRATFWRAGLNQISPASQLSGGWLGKEGQGLCLWFLCYQ